MQPWNPASRVHLKEGLNGHLSMVREAPLGRYLEGGLQGLPVKGELDGFTFEPLSLFLPFSRLPPPPFLTPLHPEGLKGNHSRVTLRVPLRSPFKASPSEALKGTHEGKGGGFGVYTIFATEGYPPPRGGGYPSDMKRRPPQDRALT